MLQYSAVCCSVLQCVAVVCTVWQSESYILRILNGAIDTCKLYLRTPLSHMSHARRYISHISIRTRPSHISHVRRSIVRVLFGLFYMYQSVHDSVTCWVYVDILYVYYSVWVIYFTNIGLSYWYIDWVVYVDYFFWMFNGLSPKKYICLHASVTCRVCVHIFQMYQLDHKIHVKYMRKYIYVHDSVTCRVYVDIFDMYQQDH